MFQARIPLQAKRYIHKYQTPICYLTGLLLGLAVFHILFDASLFLRLYWGLDFHNDVMQHITGFYAFRHSPWGLPLMQTGLLGYPEGVSVYFTDSIPLLALPFKLLAPILPADFHYIKLWVLAAFLMQAFAAIYLIRTLGFKQIWAAFFAAAFSLLVKWLIFRTGHAALTGQFVILLAFAFYVQQHRLIQSQQYRRMAVKWLVLICVTFLIHLYLFVMVLGIFFAAVLDFRLDRTKAIPLLLYKANLLLLPCLLFLVLYGVFIGPVALQDLPAAEGYGYFSLNLSGIIYGGNLIALPGTFTPTGGQANEDHSYLGLGLFLLTLLGVFAGRKNLIHWLKKAPFLSLLFIGFYIFALSTDIFLGSELIYRYPTPITNQILASPVSQFRASARFFWPIGYGLLFFGLANVMKKPWALPVLACLLLIQWIDLPKPYSPRPYCYAAAYNENLPFWDSLLDGKRSLYLYPTLGCEAEPDPVKIPILMMAAKNGVTSNSVFASRVIENCAQKREDGLADIAPNTIHVFSTPEKNQQPQPGMQVFQTQWCASQPDLTICIPYPTAADVELLKQVGTMVFTRKTQVQPP